jgi:hypothetical protein
MNLAASIQEQVKGLLPDLLGIEFTDVTPDKVIAQLTVRKDLCTIGDNRVEDQFHPRCTGGNARHRRVGAGAQRPYHGGVPDHHQERDGETGGPGDANAARDTSVNVSAELQPKGV